jgi:hypothetical protein
MVGELFDEGVSNLGRTIAVVEAEENNYYYQTREHL